MLIYVLCSVSPLSINSIPSTLPQPTAFVSFQFIPLVLNSVSHSRTLNHSTLAMLQPSLNQKAVPSLEQPNSTGGSTLLLARLKGTLNTAFIYCGPVINSLPHFAGSKSRIFSHLKSPVLLPYYCLWITGIFYWENWTNSSFPTLFSPPSLAMYSDSFLIVKKKHPAFFKFFPQCSKFIPYCHLKAFNSGTFSNV